MTLTMKLMKKFWAIRSRLPFADLDFRLLQTYAYRKIKIHIAMTLNSLKYDLGSKKPARWMLIPVARPVAVHLSGLNEHIAGVRPGNSGRSRQSSLSES